MHAWVGIFLFSVSLCVFAAPTPKDFVEPSVDGPQDKPLAIGEVPDLSKADDFYGIKAKEFDRFWDNWHLVTVRYRKDNEEQRFVYANPLAWKAIKNRAKKFPEGSMLGKVAFTTFEDPAFPVSVLPTQITRVQVMKKDSQKYADTDGWGYAIFTGNPTLSAYEKQTEAEQKDLVTSCHACHTMVKDRDFVFSIGAVYHPFPKHFKLTEGETYQSKFKPIPVHTLVGFPQKVITESHSNIKTKKVRVLGMPLFLGSAVESLGPMLKFAKEDKLPYLLINENDQEYLLVTPQAKTKKCASPAIVESRMKIRESHKDLWRLKVGDACGEQVTWRRWNVPPGAQQLEDSRQVKDYSVKMNN